MTSPRLAILVADQTPRCTSSSAALHIHIWILLEATAVQHDSYDPQQPAHLHPITGAISDYDDQQFNVECNIRKLLDLPWDQCPWPAVRLRMLRLAIEGAEIYAYRPAHQAEWVIWFPLDREDDGRMSPREWARLQGYAVDGQEGA